MTRRWRILLIGLFLGFGCDPDGGDDDGKNGGPISLSPSPDIPSIGDPTDEKDPTGTGGSPIGDGDGDGDMSGSGGAPAGTGGNTDLGGQGGDSNPGGAAGAPHR